MSLDPHDEPRASQPPQAPSQAAWDAMTPAEREAVVRSLPAYIPWEECGAPEGDPHFDAKAHGKEVLRTFFERTNKRIYVAAELAVYYPATARFAPDLLAVRDVDPHPRDAWIVSREGKGLDWVLEVHVKGDRRKDARRNVARYAELGIEEYFVFDHPRRRITGWRLPSPDARVYAPIAPRHGALPSEVLGLELGLAGDRLRFWYGNSELLPSTEVVQRLEVMLEQAVAAAEEVALRADEERQRADEERQRAEESARNADEERARREAVERENAALREELERLKRVR